MAFQLAVSSAGRRIGFVFLRTTPGAVDIRRGAVGNTSADVTDHDSHTKLKTINHIPEIKTCRMLWRMFFKGYLNRMHELQLYEKLLHGPLYRVNTGNYNCVSISNAELLEELLRKDEKFPSRGDMTLWTEYRDMRGIGYGPFTEEGEKWYNLRTVLNKRMLHPKDSIQYGDVINEVITDFIKRIYYLREVSPTGDLVSDVANELYRFSLEGISSILFETRIGCLEKEIPPETQDFIDSIARMFTYSMPVMVLPKWTRNYLPFWQRDPAAQVALYEEVNRIIKDDRVPTAQEVNSMPYLKAVIREALRMYPVVPMNARIMTENDVVIGGHFFPKKTTFTIMHYAISNDEKVFPEPRKFKPERWLRDGRARPNPFGSIPFGFGVRGCVGRRIAELELYLAVARIIKLFEIKPDPTMGEVQALNRTVLVADRQVNLHFVERQNTPQS
ncbi:Sterol 26-hydroxylase, mitochondrial [Triplophysa tibetana]|uniref:Sterol 26-hydroxylase, mitochondrial n=1 Tax=Triplophysa tibetana TaxID=1572043 RepID=A0A5A9P323_9TELE|nr:Sterol 26-hydroxylase, mitochondrial [Triplophysa tibetana]